MKRAVKVVVLTTLLFVFIVGAYLGTALLTARLESPDIRALDSGGETVTIFLSTGLLHADILIPATKKTLAEFSYLRKTHLPLDHANLRYLSIGWGSKAFYTTAGTYSDVRLSAVAKAVTGDEAVLRVVALGPVSASEDNIPIGLNDAQLRALISYVKSGFTLGPDKTPIQLKEKSIGQGDVFYEGEGNFNIFYPCNQWVNNALRKSGIKIGRWTPTTQALRQSLEFFGEVAEAN